MAREILVDTRDHFVVLTFDIAAFDGLALVVIFLTLAEGDDEFDVFATGEEFRGDDGHPLFFACGELLDLLAAGKKFAGFGIDGPGVRLPAFVQAEAKAGVVEPELATFEGHKRAFELNVPFPGRADFRPGKDEPCDDFITELIVKPRPAIDDRHAERFLTRRFLFWHKAIISEVTAQKKKPHSTRLGVEYVGVVPEQSTIRLFLCGITRRCRPGVCWLCGAPDGELAVRRRCVGAP